MSVKSIYGEVITPRAFAREMLLTTLPAHLFQNPDLKWLDAGAGQGCFSAVLREILNETLAAVMPPDMDAATRDKHIVTKMIHMVELNPDNVAHHLRPMFGPGANIYEADYISWNACCRVDVIIGNPPFNCDGAIKVPTNAAADKRDDGRTIWPQFVMKNLQILRANTNGGGGGFMCILVPSIWMKPADKSGIFAALISHPDPARIHTITRLRCFTSLQANRIFRSGGGAQTPCCYFSLETRPHLSPSQSNTSTSTSNSTSNTMKCIELVDEMSAGSSCKYIQYSLDPPRPIPLNCAGIINKLAAQMPHPGAHVRVLKTNMPPKGATFGPPDMTASTPEYPYPCVHSCILDTHTKEPRLVIRYSSRPCAYAGIPKIILAHKMYGHPVIDISGVYGISNRDNYVVEIERDATGAAPDAEWARQMQLYLSSPIARLVYDATRYRMQFLERYAFELLSMPPPSLHCLEPEELEYIVRKYGS